MNYISSSKQRIIEEQLRCQDATGLSAKVEYDSTTDQLVGLVLPTDAKTGMPRPFTFMACSVEEIQKYAKEPLSGLVYMVLAQPIMPNVPPFVLQMYGTDNKFTSMGVNQRWKYTRQELAKYGIEVE